jgi:class 3 adenylate cyclase
MEDPRRPRTKKLFVGAKAAMDQFLRGARMEITTSLPTEHRQMERQKLNLIPRLILDNFDEGRLKGELPAVCLFVDLTGFTTLTERLMKHGKDAAEVLADIMMRVFEPLVTSVYEQKGGFIAGFAGDSFLALFPLVDDQAFLKAMSAATKMKNHLANNGRLSTPYGAFDFALKIGIAHGPVEWGIIGIEDRSVMHTYYFRGEAVDACALAESYARRSEILVHPDTCRCLKDHVTARKASNKHFRIRTMNAQLPASTAVAEESIDPRLLSEFLTPELLQILPGHGEFRNVVTLFIGLKENPDDEELNRFMQTIFMLLKMYGGFIGKLDFGDKGCNLLMFWGTPLSHENDIERALSFVLDLRASSRLLFRAGVTYRLMYAGFAGSQLRGEYTCYGSGVNLAARLMTGAGWGEIWMDQEISKQAHRRFKVEYKGSHSFKGIKPGSLSSPSSPMSIFCRLP